MANKKSKTQKIKKNLKKKNSRVSGKISTKKSNVIKVDVKTKETIKKSITKETKTGKEEVVKKETKQIEMPKKTTPPKKQETHKKVVPKDKVNYNVLLKYENEEKFKKDKEELEKTKEILKDEIKKSLKKEIVEEVKNPETKTHLEKALENSKKDPIIDDITSPFIKLVDNKKSHEIKKTSKEYYKLVLNRIKKCTHEFINNCQKKYQAKKAYKEELKKKKLNAPKTIKQVKQEEYYNPYEVIEKKPLTTNSKNIVIKTLVNIYNNTHIIFNTIGILIFILMVIGLIRIHVYEKSVIIYISCIVGFLLFVAVSFNRYLSGKILTILLSTGMILAIYHMQYTYDFLRNLNSNQYEYKTYYVVTFDNGVNKSIYNINNKKVGLLKENCTNIERKLNTKIAPEYIEYDDINELYDDFYNQKFRAILVNENQYKYLTNNIENTRPVKILYEFEANAKK